MLKMFQIFQIMVLALLFVGLPACGAPSSKDKDPDLRSLSLPLVSNEKKVTYPSSDLEALAQTAEFICRAKVIKVTSAREQYDSQINMVMSQITIQVLESWKGEAPTTMSIRSFGGFLEGQPYFAEEFPKFFEGEEVILFLKKFNGGIFPVLHSRGKKNIKNGTVLETDESLSGFKEKVLTLLQNKK